MNTYTFTCPLEGCGVIMRSHTDDKEVAAENLVSQAKDHLRSVHPDVHKTDAEVDADIRSHMVQIES